jgi:hypothetical protein
LSPSLSMSGTPRYTALFPAILTTGTAILAVLCVLVLLLYHRQRRNRALLLVSR